MNIEVRKTCLKFGLAFLALAVFSRTALAQDRDAGQPVNGIAEFRAVRQAAAAQVEVIHLPVFGAAGLMKKGNQTIRLAGLMITSVDAQCGSGPDAWPCGRMALGALQRFVRGRSVECRRPEGNAAAWLIAVSGAKISANGSSPKAGSGPVDPTTPTPRRPLRKISEGYGAQPGLAWP